MEMKYNNNIVHVLKHSIASSRVFHCKPAARAFVTLPADDASTLTHCRLWNITK